MEKRRRAAEEFKNTVVLNGFTAIDEGNKVNLSEARRGTLNRLMQKRLFDIEENSRYEETKRKLEAGVSVSIRYLHHLTGIDLTSYKPALIPSYGKSKEPFLFSESQGQFLLVYKNINKSATGITVSELDICNKIFCTGLYLDYKNVLPKYVDPFNQAAMYEWRGSTEALVELFAILSLSEWPENKDKEWVDFADKNIDVQVARKFKALRRADSNLSKTVVAEFEGDIDLARRTFVRDGSFTTYVKQKLDVKPKHLSETSEILYCSIVVGHAIAKVIAPYKSFIEMQIEQRVEELDQVKGSREKLKDSVAWVV